MTIPVNTTLRISSIFWGRTIPANGVENPWGKDALKIGVAYGDELEPHPRYGVEVFDAAVVDPMPDGRKVMHEVVFGVDREALSIFKGETGIDFDALEDAFIAAVYNLRDWLEAQGVRAK